MITKIKQTYQTIKKEINTLYHIKYDKQDWAMSAIIMFASVCISSQIQNKIFAITFFIIMFHTGLIIYFKDKENLTRLVNDN